MERTPFNAALMGFEPRRLRFALPRKPSRRNFSEGGPSRFGLLLIVLVIVIGQFLMGRPTHR